MENDEPKEHNEPADEGRAPRVGWRFSLFLSLGILGLGAGVLAAIFLTEPEAIRSESTRTSAMLVDVVEAQRGDFQPRIVAMGTVTPAREVRLRPRVSGMVVERAETLDPGGRVREGEVLVTLDPADFENELRRRRSELKRAEAALALEMGRQNVARQSWEVLADELQDADRSLVLRRPQLSTVQADVEAAQAAVDQAKLDLERTRVRAPFDALVLSREVSVGSLVSPDTVLGRLVGIDTYWVEATVPVSRLQWLDFADGSDGDSDGAPVRIRNRSAWPGDVFREGSLHSLVGALDDRTRFARVIVTVRDPLAESGEPGLPPLVAGAFVEAEILGRPLEDVVRLDRDHVHQGDTVRLMAEGQLEIREVGVVFRDDEHAYIDRGLEGGELVVVTDLATVVEGADLRRRGSGDEAGGVEPESESVPGAAPQAGTRPPEGGGT